MKINEEKLIKIIDFWRNSLNNDELFGRDAVNRLDYSSKEIVDIVGPRRSGKSSLLKLIISRLGLDDNFLYINFEDPFFINNSSPEIIEDLIRTYKEHFNGNLKYLLFDEIQEIDKWEKAIRKLRDGTKYKIFITGSSSTLLSRELSSLITGRHITVKVFPLDFKEFLFFKKIDAVSKKEITLKENLIKKEFVDFMETGGFPEVVISGKKELLKNYFYDFLQKDIISRYDVRDKDALEKTALFLISNVGKIVSIESIKNSFNLSFSSAEKYLGYLKEVFLIFELSQFSFSLKKQSKALKKIYAVDTGLAREVSFKFSEDEGRMLENIVFLELYKKFDEVYYYKTANNLEVDFLVRRKQKNIGLIQVCLDMSEENTRKRELKSLFAAMDELKMKEALILTKYEEEKIKKDNKLIKVMPVWKWLLENK